MQLTNKTPFEMAYTVLLDKRGAERLIVALKGTYSVDENGEIKLAEEQEPLIAAEKFYGEPDSSSIDKEAELGPMKLATDVFLKGSAKATHSGTTRVDVALRLGRLEKRAAVFGNRYWKDSLGVARISDPEPFDTIPLVWENAYGGQDMTPEEEEHWAQQPANPVGRGFRAKKSRAPWKDTLAPNIEDPADLLRKPDHEVTPVGFGPIGRNWEPRVNYVGTCDEKWMEERMPLLPSDFDERFHNAAPPGLITQGYLAGGEPVEVTGCTRRGRLAFTLPRVVPQTGVKLDGALEPLELHLNTVTVDTDRMQLRLFWKGDMQVHGRILKLKYIECRLAGETP